MRFIQFGCWNNLNEKKGKIVGKIKSVMTKLKQIGKPDFIIVSGDNYYPGKEKLEKDKKKMVYFDKLHRPKRKMRQNIIITYIFYNYVSSSLLNVFL